MKTIKKSISFILVILMLYTCAESIMPVFAENVVLEYDERNIETEDDVEFIMEDETSRTSNTKNIFNERWIL